MAQASEMSPVRSDDERRVQVLRGVLAVAKIEGQIAALSGLARLACPYLDESLVWRWNEGYTEGTMVYAGFEADTPVPERIVEQQRQLGDALRRRNEETGR